MQRKSCPIAWVQKMFEGLSGMEFWGIVRMSFKIGHQSNSLCKGKAETGFEGLKCAWTHMKI